MRYYSESVSRRLLGDNVGEKKINSSRKGILELRSPSLPTITEGEGFSELLITL